MGQSMLISTILKAQVNIYAQLGAEQSALAPGEELLDHPLAKAEVGEPRHHAALGLLHNHIATPTGHNQDE